MRALRVFSFAVVCFLMLLAGCVREAGPELVSESALRGEAEFRLAKISGQIDLTGLRKPVTVLRDKWGVPHIYADSVEDLFFAQGFVAAQDRLYQMDIWRRTGRGELAEVFGSEYIERDRMARLMRYRGNMQAEWESYGPNAEQIAESFTAGINAYIDYQAERLPIEFVLMDFKPGKWEKTDVLLRTAGLQMTYNAANEITRARLIDAVGMKEALRWMPTEPVRTPVLPEGLDLKGLDERVLQLYRTVTSIPTLETTDGSNNWVVNGALSATGAPLLASDPHRAVTLPSLRYLTHLVAPGWNVIGSGEPALPGVAIGHNESFGFGFTIAAYDQVDLFVETVNHGKPTQYLYEGKWQPMAIERELVRVRGYSAPVSVELKFTRHGPVIWEDPEQDRVVAVRWSGAEPGTAGYLGSLALDQVKSAAEFQSAVKSWKIPPENLVYADREGNIGWMAAGLVPERVGWEGLLPVPGASGKYAWKGFLPTEELPQVLNPAQGFIATANHNIVPEGFRHTAGYDWSAPYRYERIAEVLQQGKAFTREDFQRLQQDEVSLPARQWASMLRAMPAPGNADAGKAREAILAWDGALRADSAGGMVYALFARGLRYLFVSTQMPEKVRPILETRLDNRVLYREMAGMVAGKRNALLEKALELAWQTSVRELGANTESWAWGKLHQALFEHPLADSAARSAAFNVGPVARGGDAFTVNATGGSGLRQSHGATYRHILDFADWDNSVFTSAPGQSGQPGSEYYGNLAEMWGKGEYAPLLYSREKIEENLGHKLILAPR